VSLTLKTPLRHAAVFELETAPTLRAGDGGAINDTRRDELLLAVRDGKHVELELDMMPFRQREGYRNRNSVRFRDGSLRAMGRSGKGMPFLRDHEQGSQHAVGGFITASEMKQEVVDGVAEWRLYQTVRLTAPWAVEMALRGLIRFFSIGWSPGAVLCLACNESYSKCWHYPGQTLEDGTVVEIQYQDAELVETSAVPVPAITGTGVESIRAALSALREGNSSGEEPRRDHMNLIAKLAPILLLAAAASETEILTAVEALKRDHESTKKELAIADAENAKLSAKVGEFEATQLKHEEDDFVFNALKSGRIDKGDEQVWRDLFQANATRAKERMAARKPGQSTPVGQPRQSDKPAPAPTPAASDAGREVFASHGLDYDQVAKYAGAFGAKNPHAALKKHALGEEV